MSGGDARVEEEEEAAQAAPMMFVEQPPRLDGRSASDVLQLLQALIDTIEDDYAEVLERYWIAEANALHDQAMRVGHDDEDAVDDVQLDLGLSEPDDF